MDHVERYGWLHVELELRQLFEDNKLRLSTMRAPAFSPILDAEVSKNGIKLHSRYKQGDSLDAAPSAQPAASCNLRPSPPAHLPAHRRSAESEYLSHLCSFLHFVVKTSFLSLVCPSPFALLPTPVSSPTYPGICQSTDGPALQLISRVETTEEIGCNRTF